MTHSVSGPLPKHFSIQLLIAIVAAVIAASCGAWGMWEYESEHHKDDRDILSVAYHTLQLFILHAPHLEHKVNWQIHVGRLLSAVLVFWAGIRGLSLLFRSEWQLLWTRWRGGHVVICGRGRLGRHLADELRRSKNRVIVIDADANALESPSGNASFLVGDACDPAQLRMAGIGRAKHLLAVCDKVQTNVAITSLANRIVSDGVELESKRSKFWAACRAVVRYLLGRKRRQKLTSWLFVPDVELRQLLRSDHLFPVSGSNFEVNVRGLDIFALAARQALSQNPLDYDPIRRSSAVQVHLVLVGFGPMGENLAIQAARSSHFANFKKVKITILEVAGSSRVAQFKRCYPKIRMLVDLQTIPFSGEGPAGTKQLHELLSLAKDELVTLVFCWDSNREHVLTEGELFERLEKDDEPNFRMALALHRLSGSEMPHTLLFQTQQCGFASLFSGIGATYPLGTRISVFGTIEQTYTLEALLHESTDKMARALHEDWYRKEAEKVRGPQAPVKPAFRSWEQLDELYRASNRHAADHIPVKLRAIEYEVRPLHANPARLKQFDHAQIELLSQMEHARWCAEHFLNGYDYAPGARDDINKTHPDLVSWDVLSDEVKDYDRSQIRALPKALENAGLGIYPKV